MTPAVESAVRDDLFQYLLRLGDDRLIGGHRLSEWCGHAPILEEDIALANIALDLVGQANLLLQLAGTVEAQGRDQDALAYLREAVDFRNVLLTELPNGDFGFTILRQFLLSVHASLLFEQLQASAHEVLAGIAAKGFKEARYHVRHSAAWVVRLGDGTDESHTRVQRALNTVWRYTGELFDSDAIEQRLVAERIVVDSASLATPWNEQVRGVLARATLTVPDVSLMQRGGRQGRHTEHLGHLLSELQIVARSFPGASW